MVTNHFLSEMILQVVASSIRQPRAPAERMGRWPHGQFLGAIAVGRPRMRYVQNSKKQERGFRFFRKRSRRIHETGTVYFRIHEWLIRMGKPRKLGIYKYTIHWSYQFFLIIHQNFLPWAVVLAVIGILGANYETTLGSSGDSWMYPYPQRTLSWEFPMAKPYITWVSIGKLYIPKNPPRLNTINSTVMVLLMAEIR